MISFSTIGTTRRVLVVGPWAIKLARGARGRRCNKYEANLFQTVTELQKPVGTWCKHCEIGKGCKIYETRPEECRTFHCAWLVDERFSDVWKPDRSKIVIITGQDGNSVEFRCDPGSRTAWRVKAYHDEIIRMAKAAEPHNGSIYVIVGNKSTLVTPTDGFPLGEVPDDHVICKEMTGHRVTGVKVVTRAEWEKLK